MTPLSAVATIELISPQKAKEYLLNANPTNRPLAASRVHKMALDMAGGRWHFTGQTISFDLKHRLVDGHHRLNAIVKSGCTIPCLVVNGIHADAVKRVDTGASRTTADVAHMHHVQNANCAAAVTRLLLIHKKHGIPRVSNAFAQPTHAEIVDDLLERPDLAYSIKAGNLARKFVTPTVASFCHYLFVHQDAKMADKFWSLLCGDGSLLEPGNPALALRNKLTENKISSRKFSSQELIGFFFRAWIHFKNGTKLRFIRAMRNTDPFPEI